jgi:acyl-CoA thioester hydrolase
MNESSSWTMDIPLRWRDLDAQRHVYHGTHVTLFDEARAAMIRSFLNQAKPQYVIVRLELEYLAAVTQDDSPLQIAISVEAVGATSLTTRETMSNSGGHAVARAKCVLVWWDVELGVKRSFTAREKRQLGSLRRHDGRDL